MREADKTNQYLSSRTRHSILVAFLWIVRLVTSISAITAFAETFGDDYPEGGTGRMIRVGSE